MRLVFAAVAALAVAAPSFAKEVRRVEAGGDTCGTGTGIPCPGCPGNQEIDFTDTGNTTGAVNDLASIPDICPGGATNPNFTGVNGPDHIYLFLATAPFGTTNLTITVTPIPPDAAWDPAIYVLDTCGTASSCLAKRDEGGTGVAETLPAGIFYPPGGNAIYIDSALSAPAAASAGDYRIDVTGFVPVELIGIQIE